MSQLKTCSACRIPKPVTDFKRHKKAKDGLYHACRPCTAAYKRRWRANLDEAGRARQMEYSRTRWTHAQRLIDSAHERMRTRYKDRGYEFSIKPSDISIPEECPILSVPFVPADLGGNFNPLCPSLDRIDNSRGYVPGNIAVISREANAAKSNYTPEQVAAMIERGETRRGLTMEQMQRLHTYMIMGISLKNSVDDETTSA